MAAALPKGFLAGLAIKKTAGQTTPALNTQTNFPVAAVNPRNPVNLQYMPVINAAGYPTVKVAGKKTPTVSLTNIPLKASWFTGATSAGINLISDLIGAAASFLDTNNNTSEYAVQVDDSINKRVYDGCHCSQLSFYQTAPGGPILMDLQFVAIYGDSEKGSPTTFASVTSDPGVLLDVTNVDFNATATDVQWWRLTFQRPQGYQPTCDGTLYMASVESGMFGGTLVMQQGGNAATVPSTSATIKVSNGGGAGTGIQFALNLSKDEKVEDITPSLLPQQNSWTLFNSSGGYPVALSAF